MAMNYNEYMAVTTVACFLQYNFIGVQLMRCRIPFIAHPVTKSWYRLALKKEDAWMSFHGGVGTSDGSSSSIFVDSCTISL